MSVLVWKYDEHISIVGQKRKEFETHNLSLGVI